MAVLSCDIFSKSLKMGTSLKVILPQDKQPKPIKPVVLYLLHGLSDNCSAWLNHTTIYNYAMDRNIAIIMPEVQRSFYHDMKYGHKYFEYITVELPQLVKSLFGLDTSKSNSFIAGVSMGGFGALKAGLTYPEKYNGVAAFSSAIDFIENIKKVQESSPDDDLINEDFKACFGENLEVPESCNLFKLAEDMVEKTNNDKRQTPKIILTCGYNDFLYEQNKRFIKKLKDLQVNHLYSEWDGEHNWLFWEQSLPLAFDYLFDDKRIIQAIKEEFEMY